VQQIVAGDSYRSQTANAAHFGLGAVGQVDRLEVRWPNGRTSLLENPAIDQYHMID
jgi:hypothetical protein